MRELDRVAVEDFGLTLLQMMENAGRNLSDMALQMLAGKPSVVTVLAGSGGNGGGGLCAARHLHNRGVQVTLVLTRDPEALDGATKRQFETLRASGLEPISADQSARVISGASLTIDALIGYGLKASATGQPANLINQCNRFASTVLSLDVPSGLDATTGTSGGPVVRADHLLTLALPKTGLSHPDMDVGRIFLADIGIPPAAVERVVADFESPFGVEYILPLSARASSVTLDEM